MTDYVPPKKNDLNGYVFYTALSSRTADGTFLANPTLAAGDVQVSKDGAAFGNLGTLPVVTPAAGTAVKVTLSQDEINADNVVVKFADAAGAEWCSKVFNFQTATRQLVDLAYPTTSGRSLDVTATGAAGVDWGNLENPTTANGLTGTTIATTQVVATATALGAQAKADVNAEVVDALATDTYAEPGQGAPLATTTLAAKINYMYKAWRNKRTQTATTFSLYADDASTVDQKSTVSDDGSTATRGELASGP